MALFGKKNANYISAKETKRISKENRKITNEIEKKRNRKNIPESEYITTMKNPENVVEFDNVHTYFFTDIGTVKAVDGVSFEIPQGKTVGVVGESGCGKSVTSLSLMQLVLSSKLRIRNVKSTLRSWKFWFHAFQPDLCKAHPLRKKPLFP